MVRSAACLLLLTGFGTWLLGPGRAGADETPAAAASTPQASPWRIPEENQCQPSGGLRGAPGEDAPALPFRPGDSFDLERLQALRDFLPPELWQFRERFFYEGMRLEIGPCFRDYSAPDFYRQATEKFLGQPRLGENGGLEGYVAGRPFPADTIDPEDPRAGLRWAWNAQHRYQGAGFRGRFRVTDLLGRTGRAEPFEGEIFKMQLSHRSDRADSDFEMSFAQGNSWVAGGRFTEPFDAREHAWRQYRHVDSLTQEIRSDDLHAYLPQWRRVRRISANDVEGLYMPSFSVGVVSDQQLVVGGQGSGGVAAAGGAAASGSGTIMTKRSGFEGLELRPLLYEFRVVAVRDLLAPINADQAMFPEAPEAQFGPWGLSFASNRWDLRRALVLEGRLKDQVGQRGQSRVVMYLDLQTLSPLYYVSYDRRNEIMDVGVFAGRWSEDRSDYPRWPDDAERPVRVIDSVGEAFANLAEAGSWRRESWDFVAVPPTDKELQRLVSVSQLTKGR